MRINKTYLKLSLAILCIVVDFIYIKLVFAIQYQNSNSFALPNTLIALPNGYDAKVRWIIPPIISKKAFAGNYVKKVEDIRFIVDKDEQFWITVDRKKIFAPLKNIGFEINESITEIVPIKNGGFLFSNIRSLGIPVFSKLLKNIQNFSTSNYNSGLFVNKLPEVEFQPFTQLPSIGSRIFAMSDGDGLFCITEEKKESGGNTIYNVYILELAPVKGSSSEVWVWQKIFESELPITYIAGNKNNVYLLIDKIIFVQDFQTNRLEKLVKVNYDIRQLVPTKYGLFCTTKDMVGFLDKDIQIYFIKTPYPFISSNLQSDKLYVLFTNTLGVAEIADISIFSKVIKKS